MPHETFNLVYVGFDSSAFYAESGEPLESYNTLEECKNVNAHGLVDLVHRNTVYKEYKEGKTKFSVPDSVW